MLKLVFPNCLPMVLYLIEKGDLSDNFKLNPELFRNDTSLFPPVYKTVKLHNCNLDKIKIGCISGTRQFIQILVNKLKSLFLVARSERHLILLFSSPTLR